MRGGDLRLWLRQETGALHDRLDDGMSRLDLSTRAGLETFLISHVYGLRAVLGIARRFAFQSLHIPMPDYLAMAQADLDALGAAAPDLTADPELNREAHATDGAGECYVILGSRMGMSVLRQQGYWRGGDFRHSRYMDDAEEKQAWGALLDWLGARQDDPALNASVLTGAQRAFAAFEQGLNLAQREQGIFTP
ncbi:hypothetical protein [Novosphingobium sp. KACC 22771]|uniref:hypothetical protein n=1 Tax=Novosphingobium sp. KACC 22771 TaxID=3025670 RepID=UPI0023659FD6|nr:hypothetical protein [Novosphingobium sp. KACC 22771]WDF73094.1 hypothetical protein PQ467_03370 [Novosphingobium sp. KACC 22771]